MSKISKHVGDNFGGVTKVYWAFAKDLVDIITIYGSTSSLSIAQGTIDTFFSEIEFDKEQAEHKEPATTDQQGKSYNQSLSIRLNNDSEAVHDTLEEIGSKKVILIIYDHQGLIKLIGTPEQGLALKDDYGSGKKVTNHNGYQFQLAGNTSRKSLFVTITP